MTNINLEIHKNKTTVFAYNVLLLSIKKLYSYSNNKSILQVDSVCNFIFTKL